MLFVTGSAPILNRAVAAVSTPSAPSAAAAVALVERSASGSARRVTVEGIRTVGSNKLNS
jgi:hypothetical protein